MINIRKFICNPYQECCYVIDDGAGKAAVIDPGFQEEEVEALDHYLHAQGLQLQAVLLTHAHFDHIYGVSHCVKACHVPVRVHPDEAPVLQDAALMATAAGMPIPDTDWTPTPVQDGERIQVGALSVEVIATPGHSPGSVCYYLPGEGVLFSGDTLFAGTIGNTQLRWGDYDREIVSVMDRLMGLDGEVSVYPGHGGGTSIGFERTHNPFLQPFNAKDPETGWVDGIEFR